MAKGSEIRRVAAGRYWREADARVVLGAWRRSGEPLARFARRHGIAVQRLKRWAKRLGGDGAVRFHRVRLVARQATQPAGTMPPSAGSPIEIEWQPGRRLRVHPGFAAPDLQRVLEVLAGSAGC